MSMFLSIPTWWAYCFITPLSVLWASNALFVVIKQISLKEHLAEIDTGEIIK